jgi:hypothetical protein
VAIAPASRARRQFPAPVLRRFSRWYLPLIRLCHWAWKADPDLLWKAYLRRFDQEHFHRFAKSYLGLASAHLSSAATTDRWVSLAMGAYAQLRLARHLVDDLRRPWHPRPDPGKPLSPYKVRLGFRRLRARIGTPADSPKPTRPGGLIAEPSPPRPELRAPAEALMVFPLPGVGTRRCAL